MSITVLDDQTPTARKRHRCSACGRWIDAGEKYRRLRQITDDGPNVWKECAHCDAVFTRVWAIESPGWWEDGLDLGEYLREYQIEPLATMFAQHWRGDTLGERIPVAELPLDVLDVMRPAVSS